MSSSIALLITGASTGLLAGGASCAALQGGLLAGAVTRRASTPAAPSPGIPHEAAEARRPHGHGHGRARYGAPGARDTCRATGTGGGVPGRKTALPHDPRGPAGDLRRRVAAQPPRPGGDAGGRRAADGAVRAGSLRGQGGGPAGAAASGFVRPAAAAQRQDRLGRHSRSDRLRHGSRTVRSDAVRGTARHHGRIAGRRGSGHVRVRPRDRAAVRRARLCVPAYQQGTLRQTRLSH